MLSLCDLPLSVRAEREATLYLRRYHEWNFVPSRYSALESLIVSDLLVSEWAVNASCP
jgi:hypothetical protein